MEKKLGMTQLLQMPVLMLKNKTPIIRLPNSNVAGQRTFLYCIKYQLTTHFL